MSKEELYEKITDILNEYLYMKYQEEGAEIVSEEIVKLFQEQFNIVLNE